MPAKREKPKHPWGQRELIFQVLYWSSRECQNWNDAAEQVRLLVYATAKCFLAKLTEGDVDDLAKDIAQEFMRKLLYDIFRTYDPDEPFFTYGYKSLWFVCVAHCHRRANRRLPGLSHEPIDARCNPFRDACRREARGMLGRALWQIPKDDRRLIHLRYWKELPVSDIAALQGRTSNAVSMHLFHVREKLSELLKQLGDFFD